MNERGHGITCPSCNHHIPQTVNWGPGITRMQRTVLDIFARAIINGQQPTYQQVATLMGFSSKSNVSRHVEQLRERGFIKSREGAMATIELTDKGWSLYRPRNMEAKHA